jgi:hypothetical protein
VSGIPLNPEVAGKAREKKQHYNIQFTSTTSSYLKKNNKIPKHCLFCREQ